MEPNKNQQILDSFVAYCAKHPELRFWQALRAWAEVRFIFVSDGDENIRCSAEVIGIANDAGFKDTFGWEGKNAKT